MDFTISTYQSLLNSLRKQGLTFRTFSEYIQNPPTKTLILRHDVDSKPYNSLRLAKIQNRAGIRVTYYFRAVAGSFNENVIQEISGLGHEIGYHYETMDMAKGDVDKAYDEFCRNLERFRRIVPIYTICMHGSPLSRYDNRDLWKKYDYKKLGIIGEPYFDIDFSQVLYLTDTGRRWDGGKYSVRDKVGQLDSWQLHSQRSETWNLKPETRNLKLSFHSTFDIIAAANTGLLPDQIMFTFHPQRWTDKPLPWLEELVMQNVKNVVKRIVLSVKG